MEEFKKEFDQFFAKYAELLTGEASPEVLEKVYMYALYTHINQTMPALAKHWVSDNPEAKENMKKIFEDIRMLNQQHKK